LRQASKRFFFEKKNQKTFAKLVWGSGTTVSQKRVMAEVAAIHPFRATTPAASLSHPHATSAPKAIKSFLLLFFKKEVLAFPC
jgi:hypothetical protein